MEDEIQDSSRMRASKRSALVEFGPEVKYMTTKKVAERSGEGNIPKKL
jgi:hypothetical protein